MLQFARPERWAPLRECGTSRQLGAAQRFAATDPRRAAPVIRSGAFPQISATGRVGTGNVPSSKARVSTRETGARLRSAIAPVCPIRNAAVSQAGKAAGDRARVVLRQEVHFASRPRLAPVAILNCRSKTSRMVGVDQWGIANERGLG